MCVLLDEVESLTRARTAAVSGSEPADAIRAVNALLTQVLHRAAHPELEVPGNMPVFSWRVEGYDQACTVYNICCLCSWMLSRRTLTCWY